MGKVLGKSQDILFRGGCRRCEQNGKKLMAAEPSLSRDEWPLVTPALISEDTQQLWKPMLESALTGIVAFARSWSMVRNDP